MKINSPASLLRQVTGACLRPGGLELTARGLALCGFKSGDTLLDLGCGPGASLGLLGSSGFRALGLDLSPAMAAEASAKGAVVRADAARLPLADASLDGIVCECVLSLASDKAAVLEQCARALKPGGRLVLSDITLGGHGGFAAGGPAPQGRSAGSHAPCQSRTARRGSTQYPESRSVTLLAVEPEQSLPGHDRSAAPFPCAAGAVSVQELLRLFADSGLTVRHTEDHGRLLKELAARLVWHHGSLAALSGLWHNGVTGSCAPDGAKKFGYALFIAEKNGETR